LSHCSRQRRLHLIAYTPLLTIECRLSTGWSGRRRSSHASAPAPPQRRRRPLTSDSPHVREAAQLSPAPLSGSPGKIFIRSLITAQGPAARPPRAIGGTR